MALSENKAYLNYFAILGERKKTKWQIQSWVVTQAKVMTTVTVKKKKYWLSTVNHEKSKNKVGLLTLMQILFKR